MHDTIYNYTLVWIDWGWKKLKSVQIVQPFDNVNRYLYAGEGHVY